MPLPPRCGYYVLEKDVGSGYHSNFEKKLVCPSTLWVGFLLIIFENFNENS